MIDHRSQQLATRLKVARPIAIALGVTGLAMALHRFHWTDANAFEIINLAFCAAIFGFSVGVEFMIQYMKRRD